MGATIAIVGAGPAGTACALHLIQLGIDPTDIVLLDRATFPRPKLCGGGVTFRGTQALESLLGQPWGGSETRSIHFASSVGEVEIWEQGTQWVYDRSRLDHALLEACIERGVQVRTGELVQSIEPAVQGWRIRSGSRMERFDWVVGADGACGITRREAKLGGGHMGRLVEAVFEQVDAPEQPDKLYFDFDPLLDNIPGYAWIFPYPGPQGGEKLWKLGIMDARGQIPGKDLRTWTRRFAERRGYRMCDAKMAGWPERYIGLGTQGHRPGLILVGEAFGIDPLLGEGIAPALFHAAYAAKRLKTALDQNRDRIPAYEWGFWKEREGRNLLFQWQLANLIYGPSGLSWLRILFQLPRLRELAQAGNDNYGRLAKHAPSLSTSYLGYILSHGIPSATRP